MKVRWMMSALALMAVISCGVAQAQPGGEAMLAPPPPVPLNGGALNGGALNGGAINGGAINGGACNGYACDTGCGVGCDSCFQGCGRGRWIFDSEALFMRYHRSAGVDSGYPPSANNGSQDIEFGFEATPRVTIGYTAPDGLGVRFRWWDYDHKALGAADRYDSIAVDAFTMDIEVFEEIQLTENVSIEGSGGFRLVNFREDVTIGYSPDYYDLGSSRYGAYGAVVGVQLKRCICVGAVFARARYSITMGDAAFEGETYYGVDHLDNGTYREERYDTVQSIVELSLGYELCWELCNGSTLSVRAGAEWQHWSNFDYTSPYVAGGLIPGDVGFGGFFVGAGLTF